MPSNQGSESLLTVLGDIPSHVIHEAAYKLWSEARAHPPTSSCECPALEAFCVLYDMGYKVVKVDG